MYRIRFHGRGGQGVKTASRVLGSALFHVGYEVQDAPRYGAERRGAPIFAYVRADRDPIEERGVIHRPDLVVVIDETLLPLPPANVLEGVDDHTVVLVKTARPPHEWAAELDIPGTVLALPTLEAGLERGALPLAAVAAAGAAARLLGGISAAVLEAAVHDELAPLGEAVTRRNREYALAAYAAMAEREGTVRESPPAASEAARAEWVDFPFEPAHVSQPTVYAEGNAELQQTGLWRTERPVIDLEACKRCTWVCGTYCPDSAMSVREDGYPEIDYEHCKGCMICLVQCPPHAIHAVPEPRAGEEVQP